MTEIAALGLRVDGADGIEKSASALDHLTKSADSAEKATDRLNKESGKSKKALNDVARSGEDASGSVSSLAAAAARAGAIIGAAFSVTAILRYADAWSDMTSLVRVNIGAQENAADVMSRLSYIARMTYSSMEATSRSFSTNAFTLNALGKSTQQQLDYTEALNNALVVSGARGQQFEMVQNSLNRAMAEGSLRGIELQNVLNYGSRVAGLLAEELGVNVTELRALAAQGEITGEVIYSSLTKNMELVRKEAETMPATIGDGFILLRNSMLEFVGRADQAVGVSSRLSSGMISVADAIASASGETGALTTTLDQLSSRMDTVEYATLGALDGLQSFGRWFDEFVIPFEFLSFLGGIADRMNPIASAGRALDHLGASSRKAADDADRLAKAQENLNTRMQVGAAIANRRAAALSQSQADVIAQEEALADAIDQSRRAAEVAIPVYLRMRDAQQADRVRDLVSALAEERAMLQMTGAEQAIYNYMKEEGWGHTEEQRQAVIGHIEALYAEREALSAVGKQAERSAEVMRSSFGLTERYISSALMQIGQTAGGAWQTIASSFRDMIRRMLADWAASGIVRMFTGGGAMGASSMAMASGGGGGGLGGIMSSLAAIPSAIGAGFSAGLHNVAQFIGTGNAVGGGLLSFGGNMTRFGSTLGLSPDMAMLGGTLATAGLGAAGGWAGQQLGSAIFGKQAESNWGASIGAGLGAIFGGPLAPLGALIGGGLGGLVDSLAGGDGNKRAALGVETDPRIMAAARGMTGYQVQGASGLTFTGRATRADEDAANQLVDLFADIDTQLTGLFGIEGRLAGRSLAGGSSQAGLATQESGLNSFFGSAEFNRLIEDDIEAAVGHFMDAWLAAARDVVDDTPIIRLMSRISHEELPAAVEAFSALQAVMGRDVVSAAREAATQQTSMVTSYRDSSAAAWDAINAYDGSVAATQLLVSTMDMQQQAAYQLAFAYEQASGSVESLFGNLSESIRTSLMSQEELYNYQRNQIDVLSAALLTMTDPEDILRTSEQIVQRTEGMWSRLDEAQRAAMGDDFLNVIEATQQAALDRLSIGMSDLETSQTRINEMLEQRLESAATLSMAAAERQAEAATVIAQGAQVIFAAAGQISQAISQAAAGREVA